MSFIDVFSKFFVLLFSCYLVALHCFSFRGKLPLAGTAEDLVYQYMLQQNRPYAPLQISENLHDAVKKTVVSKILDSLCDDGHMVAKTYNKSKIYHIDQDMFPDADPATIRDLDDQLENLSRRFTSLKSEVATLSAEVSSLENSPGTEDAIATLASVSASNIAKKEKLAAIKDNQGDLSNNSIDEVKTKYGSYVREWNKRKRACNEMMDMYLEHVTKTKKLFMREQGLETDEEHKVDIKQHITLADQLGVLKPVKPVKKFIRK